MERQKASFLFVLPENTAKTNGVTSGFNWIYNLELLWS